MPNSIADSLTPTQRRQEIAAILGRGLLRFNFQLRIAHLLTPC